MRGKHRGRLDGAYMDINDMIYIKKQKNIYIKCSNRLLLLLQIYLCNAKDALLGGFSDSACGHKVHFARLTTRRIRLLSKNMFKRPFQTGLEVLVFDTGVKLTHELAIWLERVESKHERCVAQILNKNNLISSRRVKIRSTWWGFSYNRESMVSERIACRICHPNVRVVNSP